ncbi:MAG TPA: nucleotide sugar dehydrogenase [Acidimicrobiales bacterium]|nr:nucleotide sugar dehydrogenase [Acidimicrobiales bacterium]
MNVVVVGLGKIGLPLAVQIAGRGHRVVGADIDGAVVEKVTTGTAPFAGEDGLDERLAEVVAAGRLEATTDTSHAVEQSDTVVVVVPLVVDADRSPDFSAMDAATTAVAKGLRPGTLVVYETTLPVFSSRHRLAPLLEEVSGLTSGRDFFVCHSPERVYSGRIFADLRRYPKLVGALQPEGAARAVAFYEAVLEFDDRPDLERENGVWDLGSAEAAEMAKLAETTYRNVNIAFANELAVTADAVGVDVRAVIEAANSQPFSHIHQPGIAVGGHCIPVYPYFLLAGRPDAVLVRQALGVNEAMPAYAVGVLASMLGGLGGRTVAVLGASYRGGVKATDFSGVFAVVEALAAAGARPRVHDPLYTDEELGALGFAPYHLGDQVDAAVVQTDHEAYRALGPADLPGAKAVVDGRAMLDPDRFGDVAVRRLGVGTDAAQAVPPTARSSTSR